MKSLIVAVLLIGLASIKRDVEVVKWPQLQEYILQKKDKIKVINFWATWCKPCVEELPHFEKLHREYKDKQVEVLLVSLDQASLKDKVVATLEKNDITTRVMLLDEVDFNKWINGVDSNWSGSIPATLIITKDNEHKRFYEQPLYGQELEKIIMSLNP
ncbi:MAG: TlpA family protein disulfide reductase [Chitinophagaceae bacterium]|nr:TlpA family protein disulfide reductase [Chitinophagaceae bacterium]